ncbi:MAG: YihY/virulence factor BrkB family protein [Thermodesulfobacteria bacterium]|nr:YihY/virulence factor BrkB family protein [Thermodesulfobacteriota bacterium]
MPSGIILLREIFWRFWQDRCLTNAQALTYNTVFALVPLLAFALSMVRFFVGTEDILMRLNEALSQFLNPGALSRAQEVVLDLISKAQKGPLGAASMAIFITMVLGLLMQFEGVLNQIFRIENQRSFLHRLTVYWMGLTLGPLLVALPLGVTIYLTHMGLKGTGVASLFLKFWTIPTIILLFTIIFLYLPAKRIKLIPAIVGASTAGILWTIVASLYAIYTSKAVAYSKLYGSLSTIPLFLLWLWVNWSLVLLGAEVAGVLNQRREILAHYRANRKLSWLLFGLGALIEIYEAHFRGVPGPCIAELAENMGASPFDLLKLLKRLEKAGIIQCFDERYYPARAADNLNLLEVQRALEGELPDEPPEAPSLRVPYQFLKERENFWRGKTVKDMLQEVLKEEEELHGPMPDLSPGEGHHLHTPSSPAPM